MKKTKFEFGEKILVTGEIQRIKKDRIGNKEVIIPFREWIRYEHPPRPALFLNGINLSNGTVEYESYGDEGGTYVFNPSELIPGAWICEYNRAPRKVFLSDCKKIK